MKSSKKVSALLEIIGFLAIFLLAILLIGFLVIGLMWGFWTSGL